MGRGRAGPASAAAGQTGRQTAGRPAEQPAWLLVGLPVLIGAGSARLLKLTRTIISAIESRRPPLKWPSQAQPVTVRGRRAVTFRVRDVFGWGRG